MLVAYVVTLYFACVLAVSGLSKLRDPQAFGATLGKHGLLPIQVIRPVAVGLPWGQVALAVVLPFGIFAQATSSLVLLLFVIFLAVEVFLVVSKRATDCGCYGVAFPQRVDMGSIASSAIQVALAFGLMAAAAPPEEIALLIRVGVGGIFATAVVLLAWLALGRDNTWRLALGQQRHWETGHGGVAWTR